MQKTIYRYIFVDFGPNPFSTKSIYIHYLIGQSQNYLSSLAKETLPFMYQTSIEGIRNILKECWSIYNTENNNDNINNRDLAWFHKLAALGLQNHLELKPIQCKDLILQCNVRKHVLHLAVHIARRSRFLSALIEDKKIIEKHQICRI